MMSLLQNLDTRPNKQATFEMQAGLHKAQIVFFESNVES